MPQEHDPKLVQERAAAGGRSQAADLTGVELRRFVEQRRTKAKQKCPPGHMFCLGCRAPRSPGGNMADYLPITGSSGNLRGICDACGALMHRRITPSKLASIFPGVEITVVQRE